MPQPPSARPPRPPRIRITERQKCLDQLKSAYLETHWKLLRVLLSDDEDEDSNEENDDSDPSDSERSTLPSNPLSLTQPSSLDYAMQPSSPLSLAQSSPDLMQPSSPISLITELQLSSPLSSVDGHSTSDDSEADELEILALLRAKYIFLRDKLTHTRYLNRGPPIPKNSQLELLQWYKINNPRRFRSKVRVAPETFDNLVQLIQSHSIFTNNSHNEQIPVWIQLAIFLNRIGHYGNLATLDDIGEWAGVSAGTVSNCTRRCMVAIITHHDQAIRLPTAEEKERSKQWAEAAVLPAWRNGCLAVDGTTLPLFQKPGLHGEAWFDKSSNYSMNAQVSASHIIRNHFY